MIRIDTNAPEISKLLHRVTTDQLPFAQSLIANRMAVVVRKNEISVMKARFDAPTPWTLNSLFLDPATKQRPNARVWFKDKAAKGAPANSYLQAEVFGGPRAQKGLERAMVSAGYLTTGQYVVPGNGAKMDSYGNMRRSQVVQILSAIKAGKDVGYSSNATTRKRSVKTQARNAIFWGKVGDNWGVWQRVRSAFGDGVRSLLVVRDSSPRYRKRFPFFEVAENTIKARYERVAENAIEEVLRTARKP